MLELKKILRPPPVAPPGFEGQYISTEISETEKGQFEEELAIPIEELVDDTP